MNRDGLTNDLLYIPANKSELIFEDIAADPKNTNYGGKGYTAQQQADIFWDIVEGDSYLKSRKGKYTERNGAVAPWRHQFDFRLSQEIFHGIGGGKNSLEFFWDVFNIGNLFNSSWGIFKINNNVLLTPTNTKDLKADGTVVPKFRLGYANADVVKTLYRPTETVSSTYSMQFGLKFKFN